MTDEEREEYQGRQRAQAESLRDALKGLPMGAFSAVVTLEDFLVIAQAVMLYEPPPLDVARRVASAAGIELPPLEPSPYASDEGGV